jgi:predicted kinase
VRLVVVSGAPGSGKSVLAARLAPARRLPLLAEDGRQRVPLDAPGAPDAAAVRRLGAAAFDRRDEVAHRPPDAGVGAVLEADFLRGASEAALAAVVARAPAVRLHCATADPAETVRRYRARPARGERRPPTLTRDLEALPRLEAWPAEDRSELSALDDTAPGRRVDPTDGDAPASEAIVAAARAAGAVGSGAPTAYGSGRGPA